MKSVVVDAIEYLRKFMAVKQLDYIPVAGVLSRVRSGLYIAADGSLWESFEGVWTNG